MFKKKDLYELKTNNDSFMVNLKLYNYVTSLRDEIYELKKEKFHIENENQRLECELNAIKPILNSNDYKPAISEDCDSCVYVVRSTYSGKVLGCRKDNVCDDYKPNKE